MSTLTIEDKRLLAKEILLRKSQPKRVPLSMSQERLWLYYKAYPESDAYNLPSLVKVPDNSDIEQIRESVLSALKRHEILKAVFEEREDTVSMLIRKDIALEFKVEIFSEDHEINEIAQRARKEIERQFDLYSELPIRITVFQKEGEGTYLLFVAHHIVCDGSSLNILMRDVMHDYARRRNGSGIEGQIAPKQYSEFVDWQKVKFGKDGFGKQLDYWDEKLKDSSPIELPLLKPRPPIFTYRGSRSGTFIEEQLVKSVKEVCRAEGVTAFMFLLAVFRVLLYRQSKQTDVCVGVPVFGSGRSEFSDTVGMFANTLPLRSKIDGEERFSDLLKRIRLESISDFANSDIPFEKIIERVNPPTDPSRTPLYQVMFQYFSIQNLEEAKYGDWKICYLEDEWTSSQVDLGVFARDDGGSWRLVFEYNTDLFSKEYVSRLADQFSQIIKEVIERPTIFIKEIEVLSPEEKRSVVSEFNTTNEEYAKEKLIHQLFEAHATRSPDSIAVVFQEASLSYRELDEKANRLAHTLRDRFDVGGDVLVGLVVERSLEMIVGILGILKAGGAYVPIDPAYPEQRIEYLLDDCGAKVVLGNIEAPNSIGEATYLDLRDESVYSENDRALDAITNSESLAYVIYTSGSTGKPKGVMVEHRNATNIAQAWHREYNLLEEPATLLQIASVSFDVSVGDFLRALLSGGTLVLCPKEDLLNFESFHKLLLSHGITIFEGTPGLLIPFVQYVNSQGLGFGNLNTMILGGEAFRKEDYLNLLDSLPEDVRLINSYGLTETTIDSTYFEGGVESMRELGSIPIGKPFANNRLYVFNPDSTLCPIGVSGELCIAGDGVARGYLGREDLTLERFLPDPFRPNDRMYRTGDLGRWLPDGNMEFLGRLDDQVKIRGFRIELGEVEAELLKQAGVKQAFALASKVAGSDALIAYYTAETKLEASVLRSGMKQTLPDYMVPSYFVQMDRLPLTTNGKIDRKALPKPEGNAMTGFEFFAPRNRLESNLVEIWQDTLGVEGIGIEDDFFDLGGQSLKAISVITKIKKDLEFEITLRDIFENPKIVDIAKLISNKTHTEYQRINTVEERTYYPATHPQQRLYSLFKLAPDSVAYNMPAAYEITGNLNTETLDKALEKVVGTQESLRYVFAAKEGAVVFKILDSVDCRVSLSEDATSSSSELIEKFVKPFDLETGPLFRISLVQRGEGRSFLMVDMHHIISDGASTNLMIAEIGKILSGAEIEAPSVRYRDFAVWQRDGEGAKQLVEDSAFWKSQYATTVPDLRLPCDFPRENRRDFSGDRYSFEFDLELSNALKGIGRKNGTSLYVVILSVFNCLMARLTGQEDIVVGTPVAGRNLPELENIIGMFVNTLAIRSQPQGELTFSEYIGRMKNTVIDALEHDAYPFELLVEHVAPQRNMNRNALFDVMFVMQNSAKTDERKLFSDVSVKPVEFSSGSVKFDLTLIVEDNDGKIQCVFEYSDALFLRDTIVRFAERLVTLATNIAEDQSVSLSTAQILSVSERKRASEIFPQGHRESRPNGSLISEFKKVVGSNGALPAVRYRGKSLSFETLDRESDKVASSLIQRKLSRGELVALVGNRSITTLVNILGILKAGGAYLPIDPYAPIERNRYIFNDAEVRFLLDEKDQYKDRFENVEAINVLNLDEGVLTEYFQPDLGSEDLAYVIYTSGSTGKPKGVMIEHRSVVNLAYSIGNKIAPEKQPMRFSLLHPFYFDASVESIFCSLLLGHELVIAPEEARLSGDSLWEFLRDEKIDICDGTPAHIKLLVAAGIHRTDAKPTFKRIKVGGEALKKNLVEDLSKLFETNEPEVLNIYGPTECTCSATATFANGDDMSTSDSFSIGGPVQNVDVFIFDAYMNPMPIGSIGEIFIGGAGVGRGYLKRPELTAERFVCDPANPHQTLYRSGDLGRWLANGTIEFVGRKDNQIKVRGFRIEIGEIESALSQHESISQAVVLYDQRDIDKPYLRAYIQNTDDVNRKDIRSFLANRIPDYMIPDTYHSIRAFSYTENGKIDGRILLDVTEEIESGSEWIAPGNALQEKVLGVWLDVLGLSKISVRDNFFSLGGNSVRLVQVHSKLETLFPGRLQVAHLFEYSTIEEIAKFLENGTESESKQDREVQLQRRMEMRSRGRGRSSRRTTGS